MERLGKRLGWDEYFLKIAGDVAERGTCKRRKYGAVIVNEDNRIISTGYCGNPSGTINCSDIEEPCYREASNSPSGKDYGKCLSHHAEENAIAFVGTERTKGCRMYIAGKLLSTGEDVEGKPCIKCMGWLANAGITEVITKTKKGIERYLVELMKEEISEEIKGNYREAKEIMKKR